MNSEKLDAKIASIEAQLRILKTLKAVKKPVSKKKDLRSLKGVLKGEGKFDVKEIESVKIMFKEGKFSLVGTTALYRSLCVIFGINGDVFVREVTRPDGV